MADVVFALLEIQPNENVDFERFKSFLKEDMDYPNLFNIFS